MKVDDFRAMNRRFNGRCILARGGAQLLLPATKVERFQANSLHGNRPGRQPVASGRLTSDCIGTLATVARRAGISEEQLRDANQKPPRYRLGSGSTILIPRDETMELDIPPRALTAASP